LHVDPGFDEHRPAGNLRSWWARKSVDCVEVRIRFVPEAVATREPADRLRFGSGEVLCLDVEALEKNELGPRHTVVRRRPDPVVLRAEIDVRVTRVHRTIDLKQLKRLVTSRASADHLPDATAVRLGGELDT